MRLPWLFLFLLAILCMPMGKANIAPDPGSDQTESTVGGIISQEGTSLYMRSENISTRFTASRIYEESQYTLVNPTNSTVHQQLLLPFDISYTTYPRNLILLVDGFEQDFGYTEFSWAPPGTSWVDTHYTIQFSLEFEPYCEHSIIATYFIDEVHFTHKYGYLTMSGTLWNHPIEYANFTFSFDRKLSVTSYSGLDGCHIIRNETTYLIHKEFQNWTPSENIEIWYDSGDSESPKEYFLIVGFAIIGLCVIIGLLTWRILRIPSKKSFQYTGQNYHPPTLLYGSVHPVHTDIFFQADSRSLPFGQTPAMNHEFSEYHLHHYPEYPVYRGTGKRNRREG